MNFYTRIRIVQILLTNLSLEFTHFVSSPDLTDDILVVQQQAVVSIIHVSRGLDSNGFLNHPLDACWMHTIAGERTETFS